MTFGKLFFNRLSRLVVGQNQWSSWTWRKISDDHQRTQRTDKWLFQCSKSQNMSIIFETKCLRTLQKSWVISDRKEVSFFILLNLGYFPQVRSSRVGLLERLNGYPWNILPVSCPRSFRSNIPRRQSFPSFLFCDDRISLKFLFELPTK